MSLFRLTLFLYHLLFIFCSLPSEQIDNGSKSTVSVVAVADIKEAGSEVAESKAQSSSLSRARRNSGEQARQLKKRSVHQIDAAHVYIVKLAGITCTCRFGRK